MARNKMQDVRDFLIQGLEEIMSEDKIKPERMERLKQANELGKTLVESAKAEALYINSVAKLHKVNDKIKPDGEFFKVENSRVND